MVAPAAAVSELVALASSAATHVRGVWYAYAILTAAVYWVLSGKPSVYCMDFAVFEPPASWKVTKAEVLQLVRMQGCFTEESMEFQAKLLERSGVGDATHWPPSIVQLIRPEVALKKDSEGKPVIPKTCDRSIEGA